MWVLISDHWKIVAFSAALAGSSYATGAYLTTEELLRDRLVAERVADVEHAEMAATTRAYFATGTTGVKTPCLDAVRGR